MTDSQNADLREQAEKIVVYWNTFKRPLTHSLVDDITEALLAHGEAEFRRGALSRVEGPSDAEIEDAAHMWEMKLLHLRASFDFIDGAEWYRDNLKIIGPDDEET